jgi:hypothetical protein
MMCFTNDNLYMRNANICNPCQRTTAFIMTSITPPKFDSKQPIYTPTQTSRMSPSNSSSTPTNKDKTRPKTSSSFPILYILFVIIFLIALFPPLFHALWTLPFKLLLPSTYSSGAILSKASLISALTSSSQFSLRLSAQLVC